MTTRCKKIVRYNHEEENILGAGDYCQSTAKADASPEATKLVERVRLRACRHHVDEQLGGHEHNLT
jgi:uncharacterized membrane protein